MNRTDFLLGRYISAPSWTALHLVTLSHEEKQAREGDRKADGGWEEGKTGKVIRGGRAVSILKRERGRAFANTPTLLSTANGSSQSWQAAPKRAHTHSDSYRKPSTGKTPKNRCPASCSQSHTPLKQPSCGQTPQPSKGPAPSQRGFWNRV